MEAGVDGGPICGVPAQLDCRELVGVLLGDMSMSSWCSVKKIKVQSNLPYRLQSTMMTWTYHRVVHPQVHGSPVVLVPHI
jgi:hypothetical protein